MQEQPDGRIYQLLEQSSPEDLLRWAFETFSNHVEIASGFGPEGVALIDMATRVHRDVRVFVLDTDFLFPETYRLIETVEKRYKIAVERVKALYSPEQQEILYGPELWRRDPDVCCTLRKVEPLRKKLESLAAWITSIRRDQTSARSSARKVEWDAKFQLVKINPLADWTSERVWTYIREHDVPYNPLHDLQYPSIGCTHCTRSVKPGDDPRAGRWVGFAKTECGLHERGLPGESTKVTSSGASKSRILN
jgi:phosphoadenosine phosphosulfate reductase